MSSFGQGFGPYSGGLATTGNIGLSSGPQTSSVGPLRGGYSFESSGTSGTSGTSATAGALTALIGALTSAVGSFYAAEQAKYQAKSQALALDFQSQMSAINARTAERAAQSYIEAGRRQKMTRGLQAGQERGSTRASFGARGVAGAATRDILAAQQLAKELDFINIDANTVRAANAARTGAVNFRNQSLLTRTSAENVRATARTIRPGLLASTTLLDEGSAVASQWLAPQGGL